MASFPLLRPLLILAAVAALASCPGVGSECECFACGAAITINVVNTAGDPVTNDWTAEATQDGLAVDTSACDPGRRNGANACGFGFTTGVYDIVVRTPREEKQVRARFAEQAGENFCACVVGDTIPVILDSE